ncbi:MAG: sugar transferase [Clostridia bacterium]|nr:sugar transferase [Clostridia bacterium]
MSAVLTALLTTWWGHALLTLLGLAVWVLLSALLYRPFFKRFYDVVLSGLAILVLSPLLLFLTVLGAIKMKGNPFFTQPRPGKGERIFRLVKFRSMTCERDDDGNLLPDSVRLTRYGRLLRASSLDELPELFNIFTGQMSIVGPRPQLVRDMVFMTEHQRDRHRVRPGLTGLAQVSGRNNITWEEKFEYDLRYIERITLWGDLAILFRTVFRVLRRSDTVREGTVSDVDLGDWLLERGEVTNEEYAARQSEARSLLGV